jgi:hypothetical protein
MSRGKRLATAALSAVLLACVFPVSAFAQDPPPKEPAHDLNVKQLCKELSNQYRDSHDRNDERIVEIFQLFHDSYGKATAAERKLMAGALRKAFDIKPFPKDTAFLRTASACLSGMGKEGLDGLMYALKHKSLNTRADWDGEAAFQRMELKKTVIEAMGFTKNPKVLKTLYKQLGQKEAGIVKAACSALACFSDLPVKERKPIVEKLIKEYVKVTEKAEADVDQKEDYERLLIVETPFNQALQRLTYRTFETAGEWKEWFDEYKKLDKW